MFKIAFIKEACYQDLWIGDNKDTSSDLIRSTLFRTGPIGLLETFGSDFFIVNSNNSKAGEKIRFCQIPKNYISKEDYKLIERTKIRINSSRFPSRCPNDFSQDPEKINWSKYDIVISLNFAVPISIRRKYPNILWTCMTGEGRFPIQSSFWDYFISHDYPNTPIANLKTINMPYTFIPPRYVFDTFRNSQNKKGIYLEVNSKSNPSNSIALFKKFDSLKLNIEFHSEEIEENLKKLASSKYFIKLNGRPVRGNSFLEAMSASSLCLLNYNDCYGQIPFHQYCYFKDEKSLIDKLQFLEKNNDFLLELLNYQDLVLKNMIENVKIQFENALLKKRKSLNSKKNKLSSKKIGLKSIFKKSLQPIIVGTCHESLIRINDPIIDPTKYLPSILE
ncbi:Hypothetical protein P9515_12791 [Prochlorococcus marinus str. MIT 9515]|uniref:Uncharacterized protein n=1 Tax=Prochlorococcus marinus (strain MIT 9515) TaxID=167542 RepID=A2BXH5_PROM5|nr:hypothetical protein [Prochlorococcus marinus]ABM72486.1 Hypothetical protein P9515_12791 [Prochlorococcus marinus str. MIT 9515]